MQKVTDNVYAETEFAGCNPGFVVTSEGVVMIDTPQMPVDAIKWRDEIAKHGHVRYSKALSSPTRAPGRRFWLLMSSN